MKRRASQLECNKGAYLAHSPASGPSHTLNGRVWGKLCHRQRPGFTRTQILHRTTLRLAKMNLAIRGIDAQIEFGDSFRNDRHPDLRADYILANPPFNISEWNGDHLRDDKRWVHGIPPVENYTRSGGKGQALRYAAYIRTSDKHTRFPKSGFITGKVRNLVEFVRPAAEPADLIHQAAEKLANGAAAAAHTIVEAASRRSITVRVPQSKHMEYPVIMRCGVVTGL